MNLQIHAKHGQIKTYKAFDTTHVHVYKTYNLIYIPWKIESSKFQNYKSPEDKTTTNTKIMFSGNYF